MTEAVFNLVNGELVEASEADIAQMAIDEASILTAAKAEAVERVRLIANTRVADALPDLDLAQAIRAYQASLTSLIHSKLKLHTLAAIDLTAGWPD